MQINDDFIFILLTFNIKISKMQVAKQCNNVYKFDTLVSMKDKPMSWNEAIQNDQKALSQGI